MRTSILTLASLTALNCQRRCYDNNWTTSRGYLYDGIAQDPNHTGKMATDEANLAFDLTIHEHIVRKAHQSSWATVFVHDLKEWACDEYKETKPVLRNDTGPSRERHLHAHCRRLAILEQEIDLLQQGLEDSATSGFTWSPDSYLRHSICVGTSIITGAEYVNLVVVSSFPMLTTKYH